MKAAAFNTICTQLDTGDVIFRLFSAVNLIVLPVDTLEGRPEDWVGGRVFDGNMFNERFLKIKKIRYNIN